jgi:hypothetical protein
VPTIVVRAGEETTSLFALTWMRSRREIDRPPLSRTSGSFSTTYSR